MRVRDLLDVLAPPRCRACGAANAPPLCGGCVAAVRWRPPGDHAPPPGSGLSRCVTLLWLEEPAADWIHRFKYPRPGVSGLDGTVRALGRELAGRLAARLDPRPGDRVVAIPLHRHRLRERGFNPAAVIAREAFAGSPARLAPGLLERVRDTPSQAGLGRRARLRNVEGAFRGRLGSGPRPSRVWLVDDVVTTGATLAAAAAALRAAGVGEVIGVGLARTPVSPLSAEGWKGGGGAAAIRSDRPLV